MCNNNCNKCSDPCNKPDPCNKGKVCGCSINLETKCVKYTGNDLACTNIKKDTNLQDILTSLDEFLCFLIDEVNNKSSIENIGGGVEIYSGRNEVTYSNQMRTLVSSESVEVIQNEDTISFNVEIPDVDVSNIITSVGLQGLDIYKGFNSFTNKHEIKRVSDVSEGASVLYNDPSKPDNISQRGLVSDYLDIVEEGSVIRLNTKNTPPPPSPLKNVGAFGLMGIGAEPKGTKYQVKGDVTEAEVVLEVPEVATEVKITFANPMDNPNYFVRIHFESVGNTSFVTHLKLAL